MLGAMLIDREAVPKALESLNEESFYSPMHRKIFRAMNGLFERSEPVDAVTVTEELRKQGTLDPSNDPLYITDNVHVRSGLSVPNAIWALTAGYPAYWHPVTWLSHQLDGTRAGFINKEFDQLCLEKIVSDPEALTGYSIHDWVELAGAQGVEFLNWMAMRGALTGRVTQAHRNYHIPISNTAAATIVLENHKETDRKAA